MRVLVVEDEPRIAADVKRGLERAGFAVDLADDGESAWFQADVETYDALVLDLGLPKLDGLSVLRKLRAADNAVPIVILTARDGWRERVDGINAGADDYLTKPFRMEELVARLHAVLRRTVGQASPLMRVGELELDPRTKIVTVSGKALSLTPLEYRLLAYLLHRCGDVVSAGDLLDHVYESGTDREANAIEALIARLRRKLGPSLIKTRRGHGYVVPANAR
ncbi:response regulator transcription factor [Chenggangzhangella methanolivorans]|uniref:Response regulator transcription factor n=1 Tax=Chenggangzhangella methanolivorans TaxID=1437009 RepID=A0A9E6RA19_9HYPH|nr:response regulator transcription factor [Chenggangzhangella methanolivorans]QZO00941.1 response regulator transcription factor [Chenggangzhangella methanolivorans]